MAYSEKVLDHYENPRNVGSLHKEDKDVGTDVVGAPECGDVMKLQIKISRRHQCNTCLMVWDSKLQESSCRSCNGINISVEDVIVDSKFKTFGCGSAIASSSYLTEVIKGKPIEFAESIKNTDIVNELSLPPVKIHCSVLAEDAIKAAIANWKTKQKKGEPNAV